METLLLALIALAFVLLMVATVLIMNLQSRVDELEHAITSALRNVKTLADFAVTTGEAVVDLQKAGR